jgi:hypothetical protein
MWSQHMLACKPVQISSSGGFPRFDKKRCHRTREVHGKTRVARFDAHGGSPAPVGIAIRLRMVPKLSTIDVQAPKIRRKASSVASLGAMCSVSGSQAVEPW